MRLRELVAGQLAEEREELRAVYHFFCGAGQREMCLSGFLRFCDAFSLSPGYLGPDKVEEIFENCAGAAGPPRPPPGAERSSDTRKPPSYDDVDAPKRPVLDLDYGVLLPPPAKKKKKSAG